MKQELELYCKIKTLVEKPSDYSDYIIPVGAIGFVIEIYNVPNYPTDYLVEILRESEEEDDNVGITLYHEDELERIE